MGVLEKFGTDSIQELIVALINCRLWQVCYSLHFSRALQTSHMHPEIDIRTKSFNQRRETLGNMTLGSEVANLYGPVNNFPYNKTGFALCHGV